MNSSKLWICPDCGRAFRQRNQWHSCGRYTVEDHLEAASPHIVELYKDFVEMVKGCGDVIIEATKTSIAFKSPGLFAVIHFHKNGLKVGFWLPHRIDHPRITRIEMITPQEYVHDVKITSTNELDRELQNWLCEAYAVRM